MKTIKERSLLLMIPIIPMKKADMPEIAAKSIKVLAIDNFLKISSNNTANRTKTIVPANHPIDHFPRAVLGRK